MRVIYQGVDITDDIDIRQCVHRDCSHGRFDAVHILMDHTANWYKWKPELDDTIEIVQDGYSTGKLYLNAINPDEEGFALLATGAKCSARKKAFAIYEKSSLGTIMQQCASEGGMEYKLYGISGSIMYPFLTRRDEGASAFLDRLMMWEGAVLKTYAGRYTAISISDAQKLDANGVLEIKAGAACTSYVRHDEMFVETLTIETPQVNVSARDTKVSNGVRRVINDIPAKDASTASRWAKGYLMSINRMAEELNLQYDFMPNMTAMARFDVIGGTDADGQWIVDEVEHDFLNKRSCVKLVRCVESVV